MYGHHLNTLAPDYILRTHLLFAHPLSDIEINDEINDVAIDDPKKLHNKTTTNLRIKRHSTSSNWTSRASGQPKAGAVKLNYHCYSRLTKWTSAFCRNRTSARMKTPPSSRGGLSFAKIVGLIGMGPPPLVATLGGFLP
jgi:hypothetical protein